MIDPNVNILSPSEAKDTFRIISDRNNDEALKLPLIVLSRSEYCELINPNKQALSYDGGHIKASEQKSSVLNAIPIRISYELSIYTRYFEECDEYARNFAFNLIDYPNVEINIPYQGVDIKHKSSIVLDPRIADNSNGSGRLSPDQFYRISFNFDLVDAYLFSVPYLYNYYLDYDGNVRVVDK